MKKLLLSLALLCGFGQAALAQTYSRYDVNHDGRCSIDDVTWVINHLLGRINVKAQSVNFAQPAFTLGVGDTRRMEYTISPADADLKTLTWACSNTSVAKVDADGWVTALSKGTASIIGATQDGSGVYAICVVNVNSNSENVGGLTLTTGTAEKKGDTAYDLTASIEGLGDLNDSYSVLFYYSTTNNDPRQDSGTRVNATETAGNARFSLTGASMADTYYYRVAVATVSGTFYYGPVRSFTVDDPVTPGAEVDMGYGFVLAGYDLGAEAPEQAGNLYAWGETEPKTSFSQSNYKYYNSQYHMFAKLPASIAGTKYDAATNVLGSEWRTPTKEDFELVNQFTTWTNITYKGVNGYLVKSNQNGNAVFVRSTNHWLATESTSPKAFSFSSSTYETAYRYDGFSIRAIKGQPVYPMEYVDLGLSVKWATCNVGAIAPEDYGDYYAWGETETKSTYNWSTYFDSPNRDGNSFTKYYNNGGKTQLEPEDDVAHVKWKGIWRMPTETEMTELRTMCKWIWDSTKKGYTIEGPNGNSIFLPAAGEHNNSAPGFAGSCGYYWSSSLPTGSSGAWNVYFESGYVGRSSGYRYVGQSVRPVCP